MQRGRGKFDYGHRSRVDYEALKRERISDVPVKSDRTLALDLFVSAAVFFSAVISGPPQTITGTAYAGETDTFGTAAVSRSQPVTGTLYSNTQTFGAEVVAGRSAIGGSSFTNTQTFGDSGLAIVFNEFLVMAGQSGAIAKLTNGVAAPTNIQAIDTNRVKIWNAGAWAGYVAGTNSSQTFDGTFPTAWGQEGEYARNWLAKYPAGTLYIAKHTADGTHIMSTSGPDWNASPLGELLSGLNTKVAAALSNLSGAGVTLHQRRAIWDLGSSDALDAQTYAEAFYTNMLAIYAYQRTNWSIGKITHVRVRTQNLPYAPIVRAAQNRIAYDDANATLINVDDLTLSDQYHFAPAGTVTVGARAWDALENGTSVEIPYTFVTLTLYTDGDTFNSASAGLGSSPTQNISPAVYTDADSFNSAVFTTLSFLAGTLFTDADSFNAAGVTAGASVIGTLFTDTDSFNSASILTAQAITGTLYDDGTDSFDNATVALPSSEDADTTAFFNAISTAGLTAPPTGWRAAYDQLVKDAKGGTDPWWSSCDVIYVLGSYDDAVARRNLKQDAFHATKSATPSFTAKTGFLCTSGKLQTGFNPVATPGNYAQNSAHVMWGSLTDNAATVSDIHNWTGSTGVFINCRTAHTPNKTEGRLNTGANFSLQPGSASSAHHWVFNRTSSTQTLAYQEGALWQTFTSTSNAVASFAFEIGGLGAVYATRRYDRASIGGGLTAGQIAQQETNFNTFFTATAGL